MDEQLNPQKWASRDEACLQASISIDTSLRIQNTKHALPIKLGASTITPTSSSSSSHNTQVLYLSLQILGHVER